MLAYCFVSFFAFGFILVLVGANQEYLARELSLSLADSGLLASVLSLGLGVGVVGAGPLFDRLPRRPLFAGSMLLAAAGLGTVEPGMGFDRWLVHLAVTGVGIGAYDTLINAAVTQRFGLRSARPMAVVHAAATLGAVSGPFVVGVLAREMHWISSFHVAGAAHLVLAAVAIAVRFPAPDADEYVPDGHRGRVGGAILPFALVAFAYVGVEAGLTVFAVPYAEAAGLDPERGRFGISAFWLGLLCGRLGVLLLLRELDARVLAAAGLVGAGVLAAGTALPTGQVAGTLFTTGVALGCVFPLMIALAGQAFPHARGTAAGLAAGAGALGGFAVPWLAGALGDASGVGVAIASMAGWCAVAGGAALLAVRTR